MKKRVILGVIAAVLIFTVVLPLCFAGRYGDDLPDAANRQMDIAAERWNVYQDIDIVQTIPFTRIAAPDGTFSNEGLLLPPGAIAGVPLTLPQAGVYRLALRYTLPTPSALDAVFTLRTVQGLAYATLPAIWSDADSPYPIDRYGNELNREQLPLERVVTAAMKLQGSVGSDELLLSLPEGESVLYIQCETQEIWVECAFVLNEDNGFDNGAYSTAPDRTQEVLLVLEAENYALKSDSFIRAKGVRDPALSPYDTYTRKMNVIDENSWNSTGQKILWTFEVPESGTYDIAFRYSQYSQPGEISYRRLEIDGELLSNTHGQIPFALTRLDEFVNYRPDGCDGIYLEKGMHTLALTAVLGPEEDVYHELMRILQEISDMGLDLKKLTAGNTDPNRTWNMDAYLPDIPERFLRAADELRQCYTRLSEVSSLDPVYASDLIYAADVLRDVCKDTRKLPNKVHLISEGDTSVSASIGNVLQRLVESPLSLDRIYLTSGGAELPKGEVFFLTRAAESLFAFAQTFVGGAEQVGYAAGFKDSDELQVWVGMTMQHAEILQQLIDQSYNTENGTNIQVSIMPNTQKLVLANATGTGPDVALGIPFYLPYDFAIRGAAKNLLDYDDFLSFYLEQYNLEGLAPLCYDGGVYGAVDSINFQVLYYRKDILDKLNLSVPNTWDDVIHMMPELLRNHMNFNTSLANNIGLKTFFSTGPFLYQNGGDFYASEGLSAGFTQEESVKGFSQMTKLFTDYALSEYVANFFNAFRYSEVPIGIGSFDMYMRLSVAAPELQGLWDIALTPGQENGGEILRYQSADSTACMIFSDGEKSEEAWAFMKWWLSESTQTQFSYMLENTYGTEYRWNTANLAAFAQLPYPEAHKAIILEQLSWQKENVRHPAGYMVERESSNIWNNVVANNKELMASIDRAQIASEREIVRKLKEFGFLDENGALIKPYPMEVTDDLIKKAVRS